ncbi:MAG: hypothetical protein RJA51_1410, partial [Actinomycetota bacterium]
YGGQGGAGGSNLGTTLVTGSGATAPNKTDPSYLNGVANGGIAVYANSAHGGGNGLIVATIECSVPTSHQIGQGSMNRGHSDNSPANSLAADPNDANPCFGTGQNCSDSTWNTQRRTHVLSNGQVIWDVAGNVWEWVKDTNSTNFGANAYMSQVSTTSHTTTGTIGSITGAAKLLFGPSGNYTSLNTDEYGGLGNAWTNYSAGGVARGGHLGNDVGAGVFAVALSSAP